MAIQREEEPEENDVRLDTVFDLAKKMKGGAGDNKDDERRMEGEVSEDSQDEEDEEDEEVVPLVSDYVKHERV